MIRYRLDDLGWYQFESLIQSALKAEVGFAVESWGGHADHGRDAFSDGPLRFPDPRFPQDGPFVFQVKFVEAANAAGAKPGPRLVEAVKKEIKRISKRPDRVSRTKHYTLITNAVLSVRLRQSLVSSLKGVLPEAALHCLDGKDVCDILDRHPLLCRSFPQLLSLRDLDQLLGEVVQHDLIEKSRSAIGQARDLVQVFVPTQRYFWALDRLRDHHFVVLEGPPEVGKTAIAWMIALVQLSQGWQVTVCGEPDDFFRRIDDDVKHVFVADDAFGRTEYDPSLGRKWESQLERVLRRVDGTHWFIWTSRKHILERAMKDIDVQGVGTRFPVLSEVVVDATSLSMREKALMLYRHARSAGLEEDSKNVLRAHAVSIVNAPEFTPERIRRFVSERLRELTREQKRGVLRFEEVAHEVQEAIRNPTDRMRKSFRVLPAEHKWLLISCLEEDALYFRSVERLKASYEARVPARVGKGFSDVLAELTGTFIVEKRPGSGFGSEFLDWAHPSYRDLVIEELAEDVVLREAVLGTTSVSGVRLALSDSGGAAGDRAYPLLRNEKDWTTLRRGCERLVESGAPSEMGDLLNIVRSALAHATEEAVKGRLIRLLAELCDMVRKKWDNSDELIGVYEIEAYCNGSSLVSPLPPLPRLESAWDRIDRQFQNDVEWSNQTAQLSEDIADEWVRLIGLVSENEPRFLRQREFPESHMAILARFAHLLKEELDQDIDEWAAGADWSERGARCQGWVKVLQELAELGVGESALWEKYGDLFNERSAECYYRAEQQNEPEDADRHRPREEDVFDIAELLSDL